MKDSLKPHLALLLCNFVWALNYPLYKLVMPHYVTPLPMVTMALVVTAIIGLMTVPFSKHESVDKRDILLLFGGGILMGILRKLFLMTGIMLTSPIDASIIITVGPILVLIISVMIGVDKFSSGKIVGVVVGMLGAMMIIVLTGGQGSAAHKVLGNVIVLLCALSTAVYMVFFKKLITKYRPLTVLRWLYLFAALVILPFGLDSVIHVDFAAMPTKVVWAFLFILLLPSFYPNYLLIYSLKYVSPTVSSMYAYLQPIIATALATIMGMDHLTWKSAVAAIVVFAGVLIVVRSYKTTANAPTEHFK